MEYFGNIYDFLKSCVVNPEIRMDYEIIEIREETILRLKQNNISVIDLISNCQNEIKDSCYISDKRDKNIIWKPLENGSDTDCGIQIFLSNLIDIFISKPLDKFIGQGSFSTTYEINKNISLRLTHCLSCMKKEEYKLIQTEIQGLFYQAYLSKSRQLGGIDCEYICKVYDFGKYYLHDDNFKPSVPSDKNNFKTTSGVYAILENVPGGELFDKISSIDWENQTDIKKVNNTGIIIKQLLKGLECIHKGGYVHLDIKPENILMESEIFSDNFIKIIDFGL